MYYMFKHKESLKMQIEENKKKKLITNKSQFEEVNKKFDECI
ncbi:hypothetical protein SAMN05428981_105229 [Bacillus sp. OV194]|nr:hypothetical protein SAMN05428981_105229 [Bacillus sp. OV194]